MKRCLPSPASAVLEPLLGAGFAPAATIALSVVIPVADEAGNVLPLVDEIIAVLDNLAATRGRYEIIFVDDLSEDATCAEIFQAMQHYNSSSWQPEIRLIRHQARYGKSQGVWTGLRHARGSWVITMDGDGQNDPADIPKLINIAWGGRGEPITARNVLVSGVRVKRKGSASRRWASHIAKLLRRYCLQDDAVDTGCALKMFRRDAYLALPYFDGIHRYEPVLFRLYNHEVFYVPVEDRVRQHGVSKYTNMKRAWVGIFDLLGVMWLRNRYKARQEKSVEWRVAPEPMASPAPEPAQQKTA